jgi:hypothetical protein
VTAPISRALLASAVPRLMARRAAGLELVDEGPVVLRVAGDVVVLEQVGGSAVDAPVAVAFTGNSLLASSRVPVPT